MKYKLNHIYNHALPERVNEFLNYLSTIKGKSINTINGYKIDLIMFFRFLKLYKGSISDNIEFEEIEIDDIDDRFLRKIKLADLYAFISFTEEYRNNGNYARARKVATLKSFFKFLYGKAKIIDDNPAVELETPKINKRNPVYLTLEESKALLNAIDGRYRERDYCIITLFLNCGLRLSELCSINISKIKGDTLTVIGKGNKERTVYLNKACVDAIRSYLNVRNEKANKISESEKDALFLSKNYRRINKRTVEKMVKKYVKKAGLDSTKYTPHKLRHTAATLMYKYGDVDIRTLQKILGHENVSTTQIYTHVDDDKLREAVKLNPLSNEDENDENQD
ncbi:tyrosine recombinase XerD [Clostridium acetireducens DSM 10703]|jgi:integrase/recombinase XerD|uniref:Tyrosine recombinase XerD n=1 Tax=Clostridium acetireducens DSM 10703 TaxID=1121290 RepID=A0A1E8F2Z3_9CLOT|nr:tyrosine recombinase XerC [Clostridium acetireducens]OFI07753.1 tyrosine recombinase XerD [Clostridium acetireducens DSM 10703]